MQKEVKSPSLLEALIPIAFLIVLLAVNVIQFGSSSLDGANQVTLILSAGVASIVSMRLGVRWKQVLDSAIQSISSAMGSILILLMIGALAGTWLLSGIVPAMIYYGLQILNPTIFLVAACIISAIVSLATGSSWTTIATIGVALLGIGQALGLPQGLIGGAIISGAYFGDKMSPLSDTTNLAPAMAGTDLFTHIRYMMFTTIPSIVITLIIFLIIGLTIEPQSSPADINSLQAAIVDSFNINGWLFLVPIAVIVMIVRKMPALPAILIGALLGSVFALLFQGPLVASMGREIYMELNGISESAMAGIEVSKLKLYFLATMKSIYGDTAIVTSDPVVNELLSASGMSGMLNTIWLILCAMIFGGTMEAGALLKRIAAAVISMVKSTGSLVASTVGTCVFFNVTASDQYMAIVVPGRMYADTYQKKGLKPEVLSRSLEDSGTVTSVLVPWNTCGATQASVLGVATIVYAPFCFFNIISPFMSILYAYLNFKIRRIDPAESE